MQKCTGKFVNAFASWWLGHSVIIIYTWVLFVPRRSLYQERRKQIWYFKIRRNSISNGNLTRECQMRATMLKILLLILLVLLVTERDMERKRGMACLTETFYSAKNSLIFVVSVRIGHRNEKNQFKDSIASDSDVQVESHTVLILIKLNIKLSTVIGHKKRFESNWKMKSKRKKYQ